MKRFMIIFICLVCWLSVQSALAAKQVRKTKAVEKPSIDAKDCQYLISYQPKVDGNAEYRPGVDVHGKPVMEADITPSVIQPPEKISFDLTIDAAKYMGLTVPAGVMGEARMGTITVEKGQVRFNGKPLEGDAEAALRDLCADQKPAKAPK